MGNSITKLIQNEFNILVCSDRVGYGHIRGMFAVSDMLESHGIKVSTELISTNSTRSFRKTQQLVDKSLKLLYTHFPKQWSKTDPKSALRIARFSRPILRGLDGGYFYKKMRAKGVGLVITAYISAAYLLAGTDLPVISLGLDPYPPLYFAPGVNVTTTAVDQPTALGLKELGAEKVLTTGAMIPYPVLNSRQLFEQRIAEISSGDGIVLTIATGGSLTHGTEITELVRIISTGKSKNGNVIRKVNVVVGDSKLMLDSVTDAASGDDRFRVLYAEDVFELVRAADLALAEADVIIAKTGELPYNVAGGKAFYTFWENPSLGPQEIAIRNYVESTTMDNSSGFSALLGGLSPKQQIERLLQFYEDGNLVRQMKLGLKLPAHGSKAVADHVKKVMNLP